MKYILLIIVFLSYFNAESQEYNELWTQVARFEDESETKNASELVEKIYHLAKKERNEPQILKTFFYRSRYMQVLEEDAQLKIVSSLLAERKTATPATKAVIECLYAGMLEKIYSRNKYNIEKRTPTEDAEPENFLLWSSQNFITEVEEAYKRSLQERELLYATPLSRYNEIIDFSLIPLHANRPLYDFLATQYLNAERLEYDYSYVKFTDEESEKLLGDSKLFITLTTPDSLSKHISRRIDFCRELEIFYLKKNDTYSIQGAVLRRLEYVNNKMSVYDIREKYIITLQKLASSWSGPYAYRAKLMLAGVYAGMANKTVHSDYFHKAFAVCDDIIAHATENDVAPEASNLKNGIMAPNLHLNALNNVIAGRAALAQVSFSNTDTLLIKIYKINYSQIQSFTKLKNEGSLKKMPVYLEKGYTLPTKNDFFTYTTEIILPPLETGYYVLAAFTKDSSGKFDGDYASVIIHASKIMVTKQELRNSVNYQASDIVTGKPLKNVKAELEGKIYKTDKNGRLTIPFSAAGATKKPVIIHEGDTLDGQHYDRYYKDGYYDDEYTVSSQIYLDRAIYRPGQQVFFKGIVVKDKRGILSTVDNIFVKVTVSDPDYKKTHTFRLPTNEFGSFNGDFMLPAGGMTGRFEITVEEDTDFIEDKHPFWDDVNMSFDERTCHFYVEEYKRPSFEVKFDAIKQDIRLNENVTVTGSAIAFSGAPLQNARVSYNVIRNSQMSRYDYYGNGGVAVMAKGETVTGSDGKFNVTFPALPDTALDAKGLPLFTYTIYAEVTDIAGEPHSNSKYVTAGYHSITLEASAPRFVSANETSKIIVNSKNLNGEFRPVEGELKIYKIREEKHFYKERLFGYPELYSIPKEEFEKHFPYTSYMPVKRDTVIYEKELRTIAINTSNSKDVVLNNLSGWQPGNYEAVFTAKDSLGNEARSSTRFILKDKNGDVAVNTEFLFEIVNKDFKKDGYIEVEMRSGLPLLYVNVNAYSNNKSCYYKIVQLKDGRKTIKIPVTAQMDSYVALDFDFVWENEFYDQSEDVELESHTETLKIESEAIINKLQPGSPQTWTFTIKNKACLPAEALASMYDSSLDQFRTDSWNLPNETRPDDYNYAPGKRMIYSHNGLYVFYNGEIIKKPVTRKSDTFYTYGFDITRSSNVYPIYKPKGQQYGSRSMLINGTVSDLSGNPLPDVNVTLRGTSEGVRSDLDGKYAIYANTDDVLVFSFAGMITKTVIAGNDKIIDITLEDDPNLLDSVVVEAYRTTIRATSNVAVTTITSKTIEGRPNASFIQTLQGQVPGLEISYGSGQPGANATVILRGYGSVNGNPDPMYIIDGVPLDADKFRELNPNEIASISVLKDAGATSIYGNRGANGVIIINTKKGEEDLKALQQIQTRKNFKETAFFYPQLRTDKDGKIAFSFVMPEALTEWKLRILAHTKRLAAGYLENTFRTQKDLMITPNMPRFLREKDTIVVVAKIANLSHEAKNGNALLQLFDAATLKPVDAAMLNTGKPKPFTLTANGTTTVSWTIAIPEGMQGVQYKVLTQAGDFTDGEENILPVLPNNMLVTESIPVWVKPNTTKQYTFENLKNNTSTTLRHQGITLEYTSNPAWVALQSLPYLMEYEHQCAEQVFSKYYANAIAAHILESNPAIAEVFAEWQKEGKPLSKFAQNEQLKSVVMAETPWLLEGADDVARKNRIALLFDLEHMKNGLKSSFEQLSQKQSKSGAFPWFEGSADNEYITRHILAGLGHLQKLGIKQPDEQEYHTMKMEALHYLDSKFMENVKKHQATTAKDRIIWPVQPYNALHYLYARSFYIDPYEPNEALQKGIDAQLAEVKKKWLKYSLYEKGMAALVLHRFGDSATAKKIVESLRQTSANNEEWGMYWIANKPGWYWHNAPIETQALLIEAFTEIDNDTKSADAMKVWLIKQKQNKNWPTTKSTSEAVYALLMKGGSWLSVKEKTAITLGDSRLLEQKISESGKEAATGYINLQWKSGEITKEMATLKIENKSDVPGYGGFYWQYFEDLDKIKPAQKGIMNVTKELYLKTNTANGQKLQKITAAQQLKIGDLVTVRLAITVLEDAEYVHLKDMRAAGFEPVDVLSGYHWQSGLGYYQSTRDAATHFFFDSIARGTYILEYDVRVNNAGEFSNGITTIQSMYAPEFSGHTKGIRVKAMEK